jgi:hypothetical protein
MSMKPVEFKVGQGIVHANSIRVLQHTEDAVCFLIDFKQKYPNHIGHNSNPNFCFSFGADENTVGVVDKEADSTDIEVINLSKDWAEEKVLVAVQMGRYSATVFMIKKRSDLTKFNHWSDND